MRFNSIAALTRFLGVLSNIGYLVPFYDINAELIKRGFTKHIHVYTANIELDNDNNITLRFVDGKNVFEIFIQKGLFIR